MKKVINIFSRILLIILFVIGFVPALIILIITDIREENRIRQLFEKGNGGKYSNKNATNGKEDVADSFLFVPDPV